MAAPRRPLSEHVVVDTSTARADRMWSEVRGRVRQKPVPPRWAAPRALLLAAVIVLAFGAGWLFSRQPAHTGWAQLQTASGVTSVRLQDGSALTLEPHTSLSVREQSGESVELALESGRVQCDVTPDAERLFRVSAAEHEVLVRGTRFSVELSHQRNELAVEVQSGLVEVRRARAASAEARLGAGQRWAVPLAPRATLPAAPTPAPRTWPAATPDAGAADSHAAPVAVLPLAPSTPGPERARPSPAPARGTALERSAAAEQLRVAEQGARALLDRANAARRRGELSAAAQAYEQLLREYPGDARVGLAAFELGRLRMDEFHDVHGAIQALTLAVRAANESGLREDALARLVRAHEILKDAPQCRTARAQYLEAYPTGTYALTMLHACEGL